MRCLSPKYNHYDEIVFWIINSSTLYNKWIFFFIFSLLWSFPSYMCAISKVNMRARFVRPSHASLGSSWLSWQVPLCLWISSLLPIWRKVMEHSRWVQPFTSRGLSHWNLRCHNSKISWNFNTCRVSSGQGKVREIPDLAKVREKSGNFVEGQGKKWILGKVREFAFSAI